MGEVITYKFGRKNNWRNRVWNDIAAGIKDKRNAKVLYLCGPEDLDRAVACRKGFHPDNMIAVDKSQEVVRKMRSEGKLCIHGDILDVVQAYGEPFDVLHFDLCSGLDQDDRRIAFIFSCYLKNEGFMLVNLQRGRDSYSNEFRNAAAPPREKALFELKRKGIKVPKHLEDVLSLKHRGYFIYQYIIMYVVSMCAKSNNPGITPDEMKVLLLTDYGQKFIDDLFDDNKFKYYSYKSSVIKMDSVLVKKGNMIKGEKDFTGIVKRPKKVESGYKSDVTSDVSLIRQISAIKAIATQRRNGQLDHCPTA